MKEVILHSSTMYFEVVEVIIYYCRTAGASLRDFYFTPLCTIEFSKTLSKEDPGEIFEFTRIPWGIIYGILVDHPYLAAVCTYEA